MFSTLYRWLLAYFLISLLAFGLMLLHQSDNAVLFGRYSASYLMQLGMMLLCLLVTGGLTLLSGRGKLPDVLAILPVTPLSAGLIGLAGVVFFPAFWWFLPGARQQPAIALFTVYITGSLMGVWLLALRRVKAHQLMLPPRWDWLPLIIALLLTALLTALYLGKIPPTNMFYTFDEAWLVDWGRSMYLTGQPVVSSMPHQPPGFVAIWSILMPLEGAWVNTVGVSLASGRLFWLIIAWLSAVPIYLTAKILYGRGAAITAVCGALLLPLAHSYIRADLFVPLALSAGLYLLISGQHNGGRWRYFAAGALLALAVEGHVLAARFALLIGLFYTLNYLRRMLLARRLLWDGAFGLFAAGGLTYAVLYLFLHTVLWGLPLTSLLDTGSQYYQVDASIGEAAGTGSGSLRLFNLAQAWVVDYLLLHPVEWGLALIGLCAGLGQRHTPTRLLAALLLLSMILLVVALPKLNVVYWIHHLPLIVLLMGGAVAAVTRTQQPTAAWLSVTLALVALTGTQIAFSARNTQNVDDLLHVAYEIDAALPDTIDSIAGWEGYYFGLHERHFYNMEALLRVPADAWQSRFGVQPPEALILTSGWDDTFPALIAYKQAAGLVEAWCFRVGSFNGEVRVYVLPEYAPAEPVLCR